MVERFTSGRHAIVAVTTALSSNILVIEVGRQPTVTAMTVIALRGSGQVIQVLAHGRDAIVATTAGTEHLEMINRNGRIPQVCAVTVFTDIGRVDVIDRLAGRGHTVMTVTTSLRGDILMIKVSW